jgi:Na+-exporting ATPase
MGIESTISVEESTEPPICGLTNAAKPDPPGLSAQEPHTSATSTTSTLSAPPGPPGGKANDASTTGYSSEKPNANADTHALEPHTASVAQLEAHLKSSAKHGLSSGEAARRLEQDGPNKVEGAKGLSLWKILVRQVSNALTVVLFIVMALSFAIQDFIEGGVIAAVILLNIVVG